MQETRPPKIDTEETRHELHCSHAHGTYPGQDLRLHSGGSCDRLEDLSGVAGASGRRGRVCHRLPHERLARIEGGHKGATFGQKAKSCEGYTELHDISCLASLSSLDN